MPENTKIENAREAVQLIPRKGERLKFSSRHRLPLPKFTTSYHLQGIARSTNKVNGGYVYYLSGSAKKYAYIIILHQGSSNRMLEKQIVSKDLNHCGGMQVIGNYLVIPVESTKENRSVIQFWDVSKPLEPKPKKDLWVVRNEAKAASNAITADKDGRPWLMVSHSDGQLLDIYHGSAPLNDGCTFEQHMRWSAADADRTRWSPNRDWQDYQGGMGLVTQTDDSMWLFGFHTSRLFDPWSTERASLYRFDPNADASEMFIKYNERPFRAKGGHSQIGKVRFRWGGALVVRSSGLIEFLACERNVHRKRWVTINRFPQFRSLI